MAVCARLLHTIYLLGSRMIGLDLAVIGNCTVASVTVPVGRHV
jgi:hypothetical protein